VRLSQGLYRVDGVRGANAYIAETDDGLLVVDTGMPGNAEKIVAFIGGIGHRSSDATTIVLTHSDPDHVGSVARLKELTGAKVAIHADDADVLAGRSRGGKHTGALGLLLSVILRFMGVDPVRPDVVLAEGDLVSGFRVMHTPGHTPGSITLYRGGVVLSGDALLSDAHGHARPPRKMLSADFPQALESAEKIEVLGYRILLTGHGEPVFAEKA
jgi:glyoxylase-like metal-dependent hydrolase (beta-lactamase superfamily II)